ncbi:MAG: Smr/MutS family protein [Syntrophorhabdaceae bacterium]|nr:Smr/MutS family protein [Syntrophorhabdaceae bacterium]
MIDKTLSYLDYLKLRDVILQFSSTPFSGDDLRQLRPLDDIEEIERRHDRIEAVMDVIKWDGRVPLSDVPDVVGVLKRVSIRDSVLEPSELLSLTNFLRACEDIAGFLARVFKKSSFIDELAAGIDGLPGLYKRVVRSVNAEGYLEDSASYDLSRIRTELFMNRERIKKQLDRIMGREAMRPIIQDDYISLRNNRYVIPLKPNFNEAIQGIVHDYSHSLKTSFVEPVECVESNNSINVLVNEEKEEEKKILYELTEFARGFRESLERNVQCLAELDLFHAMAIFCHEFGCVRPEVRPSGGLEIKKAINPFIAMSRKNDAVPIDIVMKENEKVMIISGPNAGGKTAALKTIGLLSLMAKTGLFIPAAERPVIPMFSNIFALIGDEQDISMELSSFTAHMYAIKDLYLSARRDELVLIDEIGGNTEPQEASALAMGVIDAFVEKGCRVVVTTHLNLIKAYGYMKEYAMNVATSFDTQNMKPLYQLIYGTAGYSNAINVARKIDVPQVIIEKSYAYFNEQEFMLNDLITSLEEEKAKAGQERLELARTKEEARERLKVIREKKDEYLRKWEGKARERLLELDIEIDEIKKEVAKKERTSITKSKEKIRSLKERLGGPAREVREDIGIGDYVLVKTLGSKGYVVDIDKEGSVFEVAVGNVRTKLKRMFIAKAVEGPKRVSKDKSEISVEKIEQRDLKIVGMRVEEALKTVDTFLDRAVIEGISQVRVVHGVGTGRLMQAVRDRLAETPYVRTFRPDERNSGVTIVELT